MKKVITWRPYPAVDELEDPTRSTAIRKAVGVASHDSPHVQVLKFLTDVFRRKVLPPWGYTWRIWWGDLEKFSLPKDHRQERLGGQSVSDFLPQGAYYNFL